MIVVGVIAAVLVLICFLRVGIDAVYGENGILVDAYIGFITLKILPAKKKEKKKLQEKKIRHKKKKRDTAEAPGKVEKLKEMLPAIKQALSKLKRRLLIKELSIWYMSAGDDPAAAALKFGAASAGYGLLIPILENNFRIDKRDLRAAVNFEVAEPYVFIKLKLSLAVWEIIYITLGLLANSNKSGYKESKIRKAG